MSQLVDWQIEEQQRISIANKRPMVDPWDPGMLQPASLDLHLGKQLRSETGLAWDMRPANSSGDDSDLWEDLEPGRFILAHTLEYVRMPSHLCGRVEGRSSIGRQGLGVHVTAGFIDPGFEGEITLELVHHGNLEHMHIWPGMRIAQLTFHVLAARPRRLYGEEGLGSHYQGQTGATPAAKHNGY